MLWVGDAPEQPAAHGDVDHGFRDIDALLIIPHEAAPFGHPARGSQGDSSARQDLEAGLMVAAADNRQHEVTVSTGVLQFGSGIRSVAEQVFEPRPAFADGGHDLLGPGAVRDIGGGQVQHQEAAIRIHRDVPFAPLDPLAGVIPVAAFSGRRLDRLAVHDRRGGALLPSLPFPVQHQGHVVDRAERRNHQ